MAHTSFLHLLKNVPLSPDYADTLVFESVSAQSTYFLNKMAYSFQNLMYVRDGVAIIDNQAGLYRSCTYLMYTNPDYPQKWFYAFITNVEYIADGTTRINYVEDFIQTWWFDMNIKPCFVEREHVNNDAIGANIKEENVALGDYVTSFQGERMFTEWVSIVASAVSMGADHTPGFADVMQGTVIGLEWTPYGFDSNSIIELRRDLDSLAGEGKSDAVVAMWAVPSWLIPSASEHPGNPINDELIDNGEHYITPTAPTSLDGYVPKNKKLLTYPYCCLNIGTYSGQNAVLRYEFFNNGILLAYRGSPSPNGRIILYPKLYAGVADNYDYSVAIGDYPQGSWIQDVYSNWLATQSIKWDYAEQQRRLTTGFEIRKEFASGIIGTLLGDNSEGIAGLTGMIESAVNYEQNQVMAENAIAGEKEVMSIVPPSSKGSIGCGATINIFGKYGFKYAAKTITAEYAKSIDNYFSLYGYRIDEVKQPNIFGRESWNYVKTIGAVVTGNSPLYAREGLRGLLNRGIRFWHNDDVGNFELSNNITGE